MKRLLSILISCMPLAMYAQVTISAQLPSTGLLQQDQLWNLLLINNSNSVIEATILLELKDAGTGQPVLSAGTRSIQLGKGVKFISNKDVQPVQYNYSLLGSSRTYLPLGSYIVCYTIVREGSKATETVAEECTPVKIIPLSPPLLNSPQDKSVLQIQTPQFQWTPPAPIEMFDNLNYDLVVTEVQAGQTATESILYNNPIYVRNYLKMPVENYPPSYSHLEKGKTYAWQVRAKSGLNYAVATDVWSFTITNDSSVHGQSSATYLFLKNSNEPSGVSYINSNTLFVKYYSFDKEHKAAIRILNAEGKLLLEVKKSIHYGDNFFHVELNNHFQKGQLYQIEITDLQNTKYTASFSLQ